MNQTADASQPGPLKGLRVLDLGTFIAGPFAATVLGEFGAEVIKVELPRVGDPCRRFGNASTEPGLGLAWLSEARNKKSVTLDLRSPQGAELLLQLVAKADVLCENFQAGTLEQWGLGWDRLREVNPGLVMVRISAYGQTGPYADRPGFGRIANAFSGLSYLAGDPDRPPATPGSATLADYAAGLFGALGALVALRSRDGSGRGQVVDIGLYESIFRLLDELAPAYGMHGIVRERLGAATANVAPHSHYPTADGRWIAIACTTDKIFERLAHVMGQPELAAPERFGLIARRLEQRAEIDRIVGEWTVTLPRHEVLRRCNAGSVPCGPVYSIAEIFQDPQYLARGNIVSKAHDRLGQVHVPNVVPRLTETPGSVRWLGPRLGEHNEEIYKGLLALDEARLARLHEQGVI